MLSQLRTETACPFHDATDSRSSQENSPLSDEVYGCNPVVLDTVESKTRLGRPCCQLEFFNLFSTVAVAHSVPFEVSIYSEPHQMGYT